MFEGGGGAAGRALGDDCLDAVGVGCESHCKVAPVGKDAVARDRCRRCRIRTTWAGGAIMSRNPATRASPCIHQVGGNSSSGGNGVIIDEPDGLLRGRGRLLEGQEGELLSIRRGRGACLVVLPVKQLCSLSEDRLQDPLGEITLQERHRRCQRTASRVIRRASDGFFQQGDLEGGFPSGPCLEGALGVGVDDSLELLGGELGQLRKQGADAAWGGGGGGGG